MDNIQIKAIDAIRAHKDLITDRSKFKGMLSDYLNEDKLHVNLLMYAYDEKFPIMIKNEAEKVPTAVRYVKILADNYGITKEYAQWSVVTWVAVLGFGDEAVEVQEMSFSESIEKTEKKPVIDEKEYELGLGTYRAGIDIPSGTLMIYAKWNENEKDRILYGISDKASVEIDEDNRFVDKTYISIKDGEFVKFDLYNMGYENDLIEFKAKRVGD